MNDYPLEAIGLPTLLVNAPDDAYGGCQKPGVYRIGWADRERDRIATPPPI